MKALRVLFRLGLLIGLGIADPGHDHDSTDHVSAASAVPLRLDCAS